ncbi:MAG: cation:proton antiporter [Phycisphaerae bacterium]|nr:cation:proton antiporter [Phycisphaerae bacterium]
MAPLVLFLVLLLVYSALSGVFARTVLTGPILFTLTGFVATLAVPELHDPSQHFSTYLTLAEAGLVMLLFTDASRTRLSSLKGKGMTSLPTRLLTVGMLLTLGLGLVAALVVFRGISVWEAGILAAVLAPTDAGLGQIIVTSEKAPLRVRQALNVEAGLNDGLSVPFLLFFVGAALASGEGSSALASAGNAESHGGSLGQFIVEQLGYGALIGGAIGLVGGLALGLAKRRGWMVSPFEQLAIVALAILCMVSSEVAHASMFIAAFVAGLAVQIGFRDAGDHAVEFAEDWGQFFNLGIFFLFGIVVARNVSAIGVEHVVYAVLSLTVVRMLPVALALLGARLSAPTVLFMGWFGPRGLASIVLALVYMEEAEGLAGDETIRVAAIVTVFLSILAHGLSALPGLAWYAKRVARLPSDAPEFAGKGSEAAG